MTQTRIDQFYKITCSKKSGGIKSNIDSSSNLRDSAANKKMEVSSTFKVNKKQTTRRHIASFSTKEICSSRIAVMKSPVRTMEGRTKLTPTSKQLSPIRSPTKSPVACSSSQYTPKKSSAVKDALERSPKSSKMVRKKLFEGKTDDLLSVAIENMNLAKEKAITNNDIDLEKVYSCKEFKYKYNRLNTTTSTRYEIDDVVVPTDTYSLHFSLIVTSVFSKPFNCGYFEENELDLVFSLLTLTENAQALLIRMLKRTQTWYRMENIKYNEISMNLKPVFDELVSRSVFRSDTEKENISVLLKLLQADEIRRLCQEFKISNGGKKEDCVQTILKFCGNAKPLFLGMQSPATKLRVSINKILGCCVSINPKVKQVIDRIITLFIPNRDPEETVADLFLMLLKIETNQIKYPEVCFHDFPVFANKRHVLNFIEAKSALTDTLNAIEKKQWQIVREFGTQAAERLSYFLKVETKSLENSILPAHIRHFMPGYVWVKVLSKSIDAFKKTKETIPQAVQFLRMLTRQNCHMQSRKGRWYNELIKIEVYHVKNLETSVSLLSHAVSVEGLTEVDRLDLLEKAENLAKRKLNITQHAKDIVKSILQKKLSEARLTFEISSITIRGTLCGNPLQRKSTWCISNGIDKVYGTVESLAMYDYKCKGYPKGIHCEGAFPITLFAILFWDEIYDMDIPGAYVSLYQEAPMDLFSSQFYANRKKQIDVKLQIIRKFNCETLSNHLKHKFDLYCTYKSICPGNIFEDSNNLQEVASCLGVNGIVGICERLIHNFSLWKAGFPDLIVWNACTKQYKIVEVKGPGDTLSTKQKLWLEYLSQLGLNAEICYCESDAKHSRKRKHEDTI